MVKRSKKSKSKRVSLKQKYKVIRKVKEHHKKKAKDAKKKGLNKRPKVEKDPGIPNDWPFKEQELKALEARRALALEELEQKKAARKERARKRKLGLPEDDDVDASKEQNAGEEKVVKTAVKIRDTPEKAFYRELAKVIEASDVILEVLDARDPLGTRCADIEKMVLKAGPEKHLVLLLNKIDLVPRDSVEKWLKYFREELPAVAFKCSTQHQKSNLGKKYAAKGAKKTPKPCSLLEAGDCLGGQTLIKLLKKYSKSREITNTITVGVVGLPNVGKSSLINSLKRCHVVDVSATPGLTKSMQEVELDKNVKLLDCPGVVMVKSANGPLEMYFPGPSMALTYLSILKDCEVHSFKEGLEVKNLRGLHVIGTSLHESRRIDNQVRNPHSIKYNGTVQGLKHIWRTEGLRGLFKGNGTNCARIIPNSALKFYSYEEASKPINGQSNRDGSATMHEIQQRHDEPPQFAYGRPSKQVVDDEDTENFRSTIFNFSRRASSPESMSRGAYSYSSVKVSVVDEDDCMNEFHRQEDDDDDDEINSSYVIEINSSYRERTDEGVGVDEAIAWAKESYQSHSSPEKSSANKTERSAVVRFPDERVDRYKSFRLQEEYPNKMKTDEEQRQIDESKEMELLEEDIKLWSYGKERNIELQLSTQHYVRYTLLYSREFIFCALFAVGKLSKPV